MSSPDVNRILDLVKEKTGYAAIVSLESDMFVHSRVKTASQAAPVHVIMLNPKYDRMGNFLVAMQCAMILVKWADPKRIPEFTVNQDQMKAIVEKLAPGKGNDDTIIKAFINPLFVQLVSLPLQIMTGDWLYREFPGLKDQEKTYITADMREVSACLAPKIRQFAPEAVYEKSVIMGSAYALWWSQIEGSQVALLPYKAMGYLKKGQELLDALNAIPTSDKERWMKVVDAWAHKLELNGYYQWKYGI